MTRVALIGATFLGLAMNALGQTSNSAQTGQISTGQTSNPGTAVTNPIITGNSCNSANFPASKGDVPSCCQQGNDIYQIIPSPPSVEGRQLAPFQSLGHRQVGVACTSPGSPTPCFVLPTSKPGDPNACKFGPCGVQIIQTWTGTQAEVFLPTDQPVSHDPLHPLVPIYCGYQVTTYQPNPIVVQFPQPFDNQNKYPGVTAGCPYNACLEGGTPVVDFTINVVASGNATGQTSINPWGMTMIGAANVTVPRTDVHRTVTITAVPIDAQTEAGFSGACDKAGARGQTIACTIAPPYPNPAVTVTYRSCSPRCDLVNPANPVVLTH